MMYRDSAMAISGPTKDASQARVEALLAENALLREEVKVARKASEITAQLVVQQLAELFIVG